MNGPRIGRRATLLALLAGLSACATPPPPPPRPVDPDPDPETVYTPGPIPWADLTEEHIRRARQGLTRLGEDVPDDATLQARWLLMSPAQQRFMIRRPPPPPRPVARGRGAPARRTPARGATPQRGRTTAPVRRTPPPPPRR
jgi:hypothetical protein